MMVNTPKCMLWGFGGEYRCNPRFKSANSEEKLKASRIRIPKGN